MSGIVTLSGKTKLYFYEGSLNAQAYQDLIKEAMPDIKKLPNKKHCFQQDGAPCHTAKTTQAFLGKQKFSFLPKTKWPGNSPDLNPIEHLWYKLKFNVAKRGAENIQDLKRYAQEEWAKFVASFIKTYVASMPDRLAQCLENQGGKTTY